MTTFEMNNLYPRKDSKVMRSVATRAALLATLLVLSGAVHAAEDFSACPQFLANAKPPVVAPQPTHSDLCYHAFATPPVSH